MVSVDLTLGPIEAMASLGASVEKLNGNLERYNAYRRKEIARSRQPADYRAFSSVTIPTPTARTGISLGGPQAGFYWLLRRLVIGGLTFKTAALGTAEVYVTGLGAESIGTAIVGPIINALGLTDLVDQATALPSKATYSNRQVIVQQNENLIVVIDTGTAGQQYVAAAQFEARRVLSSEEIEYD